MSIVYSSFYEFRLQNSMTPRYGRSLRPNELIFAPVYKNKTSAYAKCTWSINLRIKSQKTIAKVESFTHKINSKKISNNETEIIFEENDILPNKDFALLYTFEEF